MDDWSPAPALERWELTRRVWSLAAAGGTVLAPQLRLRPDRRLACCPAGDLTGELAGWDVRAGELVLLDRVGRARIRFEAAEPGDDGATALTGTGVGDGEAVLRLAETAPVELFAEPAARRTPQPREGLLPRRHLVVGEEATLAAWDADLSDEDRSWDICLLDAPLDAEPAIAADWEVALPPGIGRWAGLHALAHPGSPLFRYDHVAFAAPGAHWCWSGANALFAAAHTHDLLLAHPAVEAAASVPRRFHPVPGRTLGFGTPVELLCPVFSLEALRVCGPSFALAPDGSTGLAALWTALLGAPLARVAVVDGLPGLRAPAGWTAPAAGVELLARYGLAADERDAGALRDRG